MMDCCNCRNSFYTCQLGHASIPLVSTQTDRRTELLDASLRLIGTGGLRSLTHRAVEEEAGAPHGSTTYWFKSRDQLVEATVEHLAVVDAARTDGIGHAVTMALARPGDAPLDLAPMADAIVEWIESDRVNQLARYELTLASARDPRIAQLLDAATQRFRRMVEPIAVAAGSDDPSRDARVLIALLDGLIFDHLTREPRDREVFRAGLLRILPAGG